MNKLTAKYYLECIKNTKTNGDNVEHPVRFEEIDDSYDMF